MAKITYIAMANIDDIDSKLSDNDLKRTIKLALNNQREYIGLLVNNDLKGVFKIEKEVGWITQ